MAPSCNLYLSEEDKKIFLGLKTKGENPSALFSKAIRARDQELNADAAVMAPQTIYRGSEYFDHDGEKGIYEPIKFVGKEITKGVISYDPQRDRGLIDIEQILYKTQKGNFLIYEITRHIDYGKCDYHVIEKGKPIPCIPMAAEVLKALGIQDDVGTFLDI